MMDDGGVHCRRIQVPLEGCDLINVSDAEPSEGNHLFTMMSKNVNVFPKLVTVTAQ
jgi:hypothetical protein